MHDDATITLYLREIGKIRKLTPKEEGELVARSRKGDLKAREQLIKSNLRRVVEIARQYEGAGLSLLDLISEGNIGLLRAVDNCDPANDGLPASSTRWIKESIERAILGESSANN